MSVFHTNLAELIVSPMTLKNFKTNLDCLSQILFYILCNVKYLYSLQAEEWIYLPFDVRKEWSTQITEIIHNCTLLFCNMMTESTTVTGNNFVAAQGTRIIVFIQNPPHFRVRTLPVCQPETGLGNGTA